MDGNTTTIQTVSGSVWGGTARLEEELTIGGQEGDESYLFGDVRGIAITDEVIYVVDLSVPVVRMYDHRGSHLGDFGRRGEGPGEFQRPLAIGIDRANGRIFVRDSIKARINVYTLDGTPAETWWIQTSRAFTSPLVVNLNGVPYTQIVLNPAAPLSDQVMGMASVGPDGISGDTLAVPDLNFKLPVLEFPGGTRSMVSIPVPLGPEIVWAMSPGGAMIVGASNAYSFELHYPDGRITIIGKEWEQVPVHAEEASWTKARALARIRIDAPGWEWRGPGIPAHKPAFRRFIPDSVGRIWVVRHGPGEVLEDGIQEPDDWLDYFRKPRWAEASLLDVFDEDGRYLGEVEVPEGMQFEPQPAIRGTDVVALVTSEDGAATIKRFRLTLPRP